MAEGPTQKGNNTASPEQQFSIQRLYIKDFSFEAPESPKIFSQKKWNPDLSLQLNTTHNAIADSRYEVILKINATVKSDEYTAFIAEVQQAGIFALMGFPRESIERALECFCPNMLYPYAREAISSAVSRGGFPQLVLAPVDFEALYLRSKQKKDGQKSGA